MLMAVFFFPLDWVSILQVLLLFVLAVADAVAGNGQCKYQRSVAPRPHSVSILEFGAVGDGKTLNTPAFQNAIFYVRSFADKGGAQLYVPKGRWLTGSFNLTSHLTLFLEKDAVILGSQVPAILFLVCTKLHLGLIALYPRTFS